MNLFKIGQIVDSKPLPHTTAGPDTLNTVFNIFYVAIGAVAVLLVVIAGFRYVLSQGNPDKVSEAKRMILYTIVGVVITALAAAIVKFVLNA